MDFEAAKEAGVKVIWALSLPGKTAPITAGKIIKDTILNILNEWDDYDTELKKRITKIMIDFIVVEGNKVDIKFF